MKSLYHNHKTIRNVTVINFKKVVSMIVMLSLMLGACGKSPARRDVTVPTTDGNSANIDPLEDNSIANKGNNIPEYPPSEPEMKPFTGVVAGTFVGGIFALVGILVGLSIARSMWLKLADPPPRRYQQKQ